ncbi:sugar phosphate nucleotidyltransferase [Halostagnicola sp. A-GB9-2]|uniref:sugar phosphate nucleotidyltransferase n=1 Tax=Halostagnicola sp. A-GB9-2 TaxID=3048066 RepID=UPI0024C0BA52|nr:sugar phosphate nucleotidyltransferase [Halostagnicola sp. A-GB9-2]MDJ1431896.1 sugar phosphate nucleotidyltransferase [Halostagnicola sp. A-GB9-2]
MSVRSAIVLAAGEGIRLRPLTRHRPKPMLPAATKPILEHVFDELIDAGIERLTVVVGYGRTAVQSHFGSIYRDVPIEYAIQNKQLGSAHALEAALPTVDETSLVVNGDQLIDASIIEDTIDRHDSDAAGTIAVISSSNVTEYGGVIVDSDDTVAELVENPTDDRNYRLNAGVYVLEPESIDIVTTVDSCRGEYSLIDGFSSLLERGETVNAARTSGEWIDATYPWDLLEVAETLFETGTVESCIAPSAQVHESATIVEPSIIAPDCVIGPGAVVGPYVSLGDNVTVGSNATLETSVIDSDTRIGANATVADCVTGRGVKIGTGSTVVGGPGDVRVETTVHEGERLGALLADRARDQGGVTYGPGTIVGSEVTIHAGATVSGSIDSETEVR